MMSDGFTKVKISLVLRVVHICLIHPLKAHSSPQMNVLYGYVKLYAWEMINKGDILVQKIKVKKSYSWIPHITVCLPMFTWIIFLNSLFLWLSNDTR